MSVLEMFSYPARNRMIGFLGALALMSSSGLALAEPAPPLVDVAWLKERTCTDGIVVLAVHRSADAYRAAHVPCAVLTNFYDDGWRVDRGGVHLLLPDPARLAGVIGRLGIDNDSHVVIYGPGTGEFDVAETTSIYLSFKWLGHDRVSILNGGLPAWMDDWENDFDSGERQPTARAFDARPRPELIASRDDVRAALTAGTPLIDMRSHDMYLGINSEIGIARPGTIPGALNMPMSWMTVNAGMTFRSAAQLRTLLAAAGVANYGPQILFCNAGLESSIGWFVSYALLGNTEARLYDGSLAEWSADSSLPMEVKVKLD